MRRAPNPPVAAYIGFALWGRKARNCRIFHGPVQNGANRIKPFLRSSGSYTRAMNWRICLAVCGLVLVVAPAHGQLALPGAAPPAPAGAAAAAPKPRKAQGAKAAK